MSDEPTTAEEWWGQYEAVWRRNPPYLKSLKAKADQYGKEWVRQHKREIDAYWNNATELAVVKDFVREHGSLDDW